MIAVLNYGVGNVRSVLCALERIGQEALLSADPAEMESAAGVILPGVGAFRTAMESLRGTGLDRFLTSQAELGKPILGICLGLQLLFTESEEHGRHKGLGLLRGGVRRFGPGLKVPHMGWNQVAQVGRCGLFDGIEDGAFFYFAHSYYVAPEDEGVACGVTDYGGGFASAVAKGRVFGVQFHPEKSGRCGQRMLANFCRICNQEPKCSQSA